MMRTNILFCCICLILLTGGRVDAGTALAGDEAKRGEERERSRLREVDKQFVSDHNKMLQMYKKDFGGGNYHFELLKDLGGETRTRGLRPAAAMLNCREQYLIDLHTKKHEKEHVIFYCMDGDKPVKSGFYTKYKKTWKLENK